MLTVTIPAAEYFDDVKNEFINTKRQDLQLEHSLVSISKWEAKWNKPFIGKSMKTNEETFDYIRCMTLTQNVDPMVFKHIPKNVLDEVTKYVEAPMTATVLIDTSNSRSQREVITSELIYYWMIAHNIPFECQKWHLNRLLTLIRVCNIKNSPPKKMSQKEIIARNKELNAQRLKALQTKG